MPDGRHPVGGSQGSSAATQRVVDEEILKWQKPWGATECPPGDLPPWPLVERLVPCLEAEIREVAGSYAWKTGLGLDQLHPKHLIDTGVKSVPVHARICFLLLRSSGQLG